MLLRLLQGQQEQLQRLQEMMGAQVHGQQQLAAATQSFASASSAATKGRGLIDVKAVGRPSQLGGTLEEASRNWRQWSYRLELWLASQFPDARKIVAWVKERGDTEISLASLESTSITGVAKEAVLEFNRQLEVVLGTLTSDAPGDITMNSSTGSDLDMFRRLHARLDPSDMVTSMRWLRSLMSTSAVDSVTDLVPAIEKWEDAHRRYSQRKDCAPLTEQQKMVSLIGLAPSELQGHLELNLGRLSSYELLRREMVSFVDTKRAFTATDGAVPMEVDALKGAKGPKGKGKKGDKGKDKAQAGKGNKNRPKGRANELDGTEGGAMDGAGDAEYEAEEPDEKAELGFIGALDGEGDADPNANPIDGREDDSGGDGALRSSPDADHSGAGSSTDPPAPKPRKGEGSLKLRSLRLMLDMVKGQIRRAQELKRSREERISARRQADLDAGHNPRLAKRKEKSRQRAAKHRQSLRLGQARVRREEALERRFNIPERARKQDEYPLLPSAGSKVAAPPSRREKAMMRGDGEARRLTPEGREGKRLREQKRKKRRAQEMKEEAGGGPPRSPPAKEPSTPPAGHESRKKKKGEEEEELVEMIFTFPEAVVYSFEPGFGGAASATTTQVILDSGASHNVIPQEWVKHLEWGPAEGPAGFRTADGSWLPNPGTAVVSLRSTEGFSFKVRFCVASVQRALLSATQVLKLGHTIVLKGSKAVIHVKGSKEKTLVFKILGSPKATFAFKGFLRHCPEESRPPPVASPPDHFFIGSEGEEDEAEEERSKAKEKAKEEPGSPTRKPKEKPGSSTRKAEEKPRSPTRKAEEKSRSNSGKNRSGSLYVGEAGRADPPREEAASASSQPQVDEGQSAQPLARPDRPTPEMIAAHEVSHVPYRSWCRACVAGRGRAYQHKASGQESTVPVISMDYLYFNERSDGAGLPTIVLRDRHSKAIFSHLLPCKGTTGSTHPERAILKDLEFLGYKKLVLKNDQEASIKALSLAVRNGFSGEIVPEESPKGDHHGQSNGEAERSVQTVQGLVRTLKASLTEKGITLEPTSSVFAWMIEYAGVLHTLFSQELHEGLTPFQRIKGRKWQVALPCFGEAVDFRRNTRSKLDSRWQSGVYLGLRLQSTEKIVGTNQGIFVVQSIKRKPEGQQWDSDLVKAVRGLPWKTSPDETGDGARLPEPLTVRAQVEEGLPPPARELVKPEVAPFRRTYIRQSDLDKFGYTAGCEACSAIREGRKRTGINHTEHCRSRIMEALKDSESGKTRLEREEQRESEFFDKVNIAEEKKRKVSTGQEASSSAEPPATQPSRPLTIARQPPLRPVVPSEPSSLPPGGAAAGQKRKSEGGGDEGRAELAPPDERSEGQKRKSPENAEGMIEELILQEREGFIASVENEEQPTCDLEDDLREEKFYDENTGKELPAEGVKQARMEEIQVIKDMQVWEPIPRPPGERVIGTRWIDINKGDDLRKKLRSRLVAQELKRKKGVNEDPSWTEFFAAMPPLSSLRALFALATTGRVPGPNKKAFQMNEHGEVCVLFIDVKKAHFWSPVRRRLLVELPPEAGEGPDKVGLLKRSLYGTRDAPSNWEHAIKKVMTDLGFKQGVSNPCLYFHPEHGLRCNVHGDDFTVVGGYNKLQWLIESLQKAWTIEVRGILPGVTHSISVLNRLVTWTNEGIEMEADPRHVDLVLEHLGLNNSSPVTTPLVKSTGDEDESPLSKEDAGLYRSIAMRIGYLSSDRPDMLRTVRELAKGLKEPTQYHWNLLKRAGRYLRGAPRLVQLIPHQEGFSVIQGWSDTDHAGCVRTRKSTTGTVVQLGKAVIKATAKGQAVIALSSGEAEYYGLISTTSACLGEQAMLADWGINCPVIINMDATTGISIGSRR
ncbi:RE2, partial [Symbiodinium sp. CCMP2592]